MYASGTHLWKNGRRKDAQILKRIADNQDTELGQCANTSDEALALLLDNEISKSQYQLSRSNAKGKNYNLYPPCNHVREAKEKCLPSRESWMATSYSAAVDFLALADHTVLCL